MFRFLEVTIALLLTLLLFVIIGLFLPATQRVERSIELTNPISQINDALMHFKWFTRWEQLTAKDPRALFTMSGPEFGDGARVAWTSNNPGVGNGAFTITEVIPQEAINMTMENNWRGHNKRSSFLLEFNPQTNATLVRWRIEVDYGWDLVGRFAGLYLNGEIGDLVFRSLGRFRQLMSAIPQADYSQTDIQLQEIAATPFVSTGVSTSAEPRLWDDSEVKLDEGWAKVAAFMSGEQIEATGPKRMVINVLGEENNDFSVGFPVASVDDLAPTADLRAQILPAQRVLMATARGHRVGTSATRNMLRAYAMTHGYDFNRDLVGVYEEWREPAEDDPMQQPLTTVVLPLMAPGDAAQPIEAPADQVDQGAEMAGDDDTEAADRQATEPTPPPG